MISLYPHQRDALKITENQNRVAFYHDMGLGKTFTGSYKLMDLDARVNLVICQKSKIQDWLDHFREYYPQYEVWDLTNKSGYEMFLNDYDNGHWMNGYPAILGVINYELVWRRPELQQLEKFTLLLDESSLIQNEQTKRSRFILKLKALNVILLSGTPTGGKYELLWSQMHLLGWKISKQMYWNQYIETHYEDVNGFPLLIVDGYKNVNRLKKKMRDHGCHFLKTDEVVDLPEQVNQKSYVMPSKEYLKFEKDRIITVDDKELVGDTTLTRLLYERQLCGQYSQEKLKAFVDLIQSTNERVIVFYNFWEELHKMQQALMDEDFMIINRFSVVNGKIRALQNYEQKEDSITFIQYQAGAYGLNLQKACRIIYFTPPLSSELFEQSKKRIHRIGQKSTCFYYYLICRGSVEEKIYEVLKQRKDYTEQLFEDS